jgi:hypothetical protein
MDEVCADDTPENKEVSCNLRVRTLERAAVPYFPSRPRSTKHRLFSAAAAFCTLTAVEPRRTGSRRGGARVRSGSVTLIAWLWTGRDGRFAALGAYTRDKTGPSRRYPLQSPRLSVVLRRRKRDPCASPRVRSETEPERNSRFRRARRFVFANGGRSRESRGGVSAKA